MTQKIRLTDNRVVTVQQFRAEYPQFDFRGGMPGRNVLRAVGATIEPAQPLSQAQQDAENILTPQRFRYLMSFPRPGAQGGWGEVWDAVTDALRALDAEAAAVVDSQHAATSFRLSATLSMLSRVTTITGQTHPNVDLSEATVRAAWQHAKEANLGEI